jgi:cytochrome c peroxidase
MLPSRADLDALDFVVMQDLTRLAQIAAANKLEPVGLKDGESAYLIEFLNAPTVPAHIDLRGDVPKRVPSGLTLPE